MLPVACTRSRILRGRMRDVADSQALSAAFQAHRRHLPREIPIAGIRPVLDISDRGWRMMGMTKMASISTGNIETDIMPRASTAMALTSTTRCIAEGARLNMTREWGTVFRIPISQR